MHLIKTQISLLLLLLSQGVFAEIMPPSPAQKNVPELDSNAQPLQKSPQTNAIAPQNSQSREATATTTSQSVAHIESTPGILAVKTTETNTSPGNGIPSASDERLNEIPSEKPLPMMTLEVLAVSPSSESNQSEPITQVPEKSVLSAVPGEPHSENHSINLEQPVNEPSPRTSQLPTVGATIGIVNDEQTPPVVSEIANQEPKFIPESTVEISSDTTSETVQNSQPISDEGEIGVTNQESNHNDLIEKTNKETNESETVEYIAPAIIEPSLPELLQRSQPQIEQAIKSGNFAEAYYLWRPLADAGDSSAQYGIGWMYHNGYGLAIDDQKAYEWWGKAAAQNYVEAIFSIGTLYQFGYGPLKKDSKIALSYYLMAAVKGHEESHLILKNMLDRHDKRLKPILPALIRYYLYSATSGDEESKAILKRMLLKSDKRIESVVPQLLTHYRNAAVSGDQEAQQLLRAMMLKGDLRVETIVAELLVNHPKILGNIPATVRVKRANTRMGPGTQHKIIKVVKQGDELIVIDRQDGWLLAQLNGTNKRVWISEKLVNLNP